MAEPAEIGVVGLGVMGRNLALNIADHGIRVAVYNRTPARTEALAASDEAKGLPVVACTSAQDLIAAIRPPRPIVLMVQAGAATDEQIEGLAGLLDQGDIVIDGGNAHYPDTMRRDQALRARGLGFLGTGVSGGEEGARRGPSIMVGGSPEAFERVGPIFRAIAAQVDGAPCCARLGPDGAGHFVKMMHNGIEYADMQLIAETFAIMRHGLGMSFDEMQAAFAKWNQGPLASYLIEITAEVLGHTDPDTGQPLVEMILDRAGQKGTGGWSVAAALDLGVPAPTIAAAVDARGMSARKEERVHAAGLLSGPTHRIEGDRATVLDELRDALQASKICAYAQGFTVMAAASKRYGWDLDFAETATIWRGGCIIRAALLERIRNAYQTPPVPANLLVAKGFAEDWAHTEHGWRRTVAIATAAGIPIPALSSALAYFDGYRSAVLPANLIQAQRDYFGAHTYERTDRPGIFHTEWGGR